MKTFPIQFFVAIFFLTIIISFDGYYKSVLAQDNLSAPKSIEINNLNQWTLPSPQDTDHPLPSNLFSGESYSIESNIYPIEGNTIRLPDAPSRSGSETAE